MIVVSDGRGQERSELGKKNRELVSEFFKKNSGSTQKECAESLKINVATVRRHLRSILGE